MSDGGRELVARITAALDEGRDTLSIGTDGAIRAAAGEPERLAAALAAGVARRRARGRHPDAELWLFTREALEQASDPAVSAWRARRYLDADVVDLCSGVGGDAAALLHTARALATVERDEARAVLAAHNLAVAARRLRAEPSATNRDAGRGEEAGSDDAGEGRSAAMHGDAGGRHDAAAHAEVAADRSTRSDGDAGNAWRDLVVIGVGDALEPGDVRPLTDGTLGPRTGPGGGPRTGPGGGPRGDGATDASSDVGCTSIEVAPAGGPDDGGTSIEVAAAGGFHTEGRLVHVDPGRRVGDRRTQDPTMTQPPVDELLARHRGARGMGIVLAPGVDADHPALRAPGRAHGGVQGGWVQGGGVQGGGVQGGGVQGGGVQGGGVQGGGVQDGGVQDGGVEVEYVQLGGALVEAVAWTGVLRDGSAQASATLLPRPDGPGVGVGSVHRLVRHRARGPRREVGPIGDVLVEVAPAAIRARLHDDIGERLGLDRVAKHRALLTGSDIVRDPWVRARPVLAVTRARAGAVRHWLRDHEFGAVEIVTHGVRVDPGAFWREIGRPPRGPNGVRIELVRRDEDSIAIITDDAGSWHGW